MAKLDKLTRQRPFRVRMRGRVELQLNRSSFRVLTRRVDRVLCKELFNWFNSLPFEYAREHSTHDFDGQVPTHHSGFVANKEYAFEAETEFPSGTILGKFVRRRKHQHLFQIAVEATVRPIGGREPTAAEPVDRTAPMQKCQTRWVMHQNKAAAGGRHVLFTEHLGEFRCGVVSVLEDLKRN